MSEPEKVEGIVLIPEASGDRLNGAQLTSYREHREKLLKWMSRVGKNENKMEGYALDTARVYATILDKFNRWAWDMNGRYTINHSHDDAEEYLRELMMADDEYSASFLHNVKLALKVHFRFRSGAEEFDTDLTIESSSSASQPKDFLSQDERKAMRDASLKLGSLPSYANLDKAERMEWKRFLANRFGIAANEITPDHWDRATSFKYPSIVHTSLDAGLRPIEVGRAKTYWVDVENAVLRIPEKDSSKNNDNWTVGIREETATFLGLWLKERKMYDKYDDTDQLWLTIANNPYSSSGLRPLLENLCEEAGIERHISWYSIRHSTGTYMAREEGLGAAQAQLRHKREKTTMKYDQAPPDDRRDALDRMG